MNEFLVTCGDTVITDEFEIWLDEELGVEMEKNTIMAWDQVEGEILVLVIDCENYSTEKSSLCFRFRLTNEQFSVLSLADSDRYTYSSELQQEQGSISALQNIFYSSILLRRYRVLLAYEEHDNL